LPELGLDFALTGEQNILHTGDKSELLTIKHKLDDAGLTPIPVIGSLEMHPEEKIVTEQIEKFKPLMDSALMLGASRVIFYQNVHGRMTHEKGVRVLHDSALVLEKEAAQRNLLMAAEEYMGLGGDELYLAFKDTPHVGLNNDIGNWLCLGEDPISTTQKLLPITLHVHLKDYILQDGVWHSVVFGKGIVGVKKALDIIAGAKGNSVRDTVYASLETDLDTEGEDEAMNECFEFFSVWTKKKFMEAKK
jgi:sugar phosphate isomerase/epimerase